MISTRKHLTLMTCIQSSTSVAGLRDASQVGTGSACTMPISHACHDATFLPEPQPHFDLAGLGKNCSSRSFYQNHSPNSRAIKQEAPSTGMGYSDKTESLARLYTQLDDSTSHFQAGHKYVEAQSQAGFASSKGAAFAVWLLLFLVFCLSLPFWLQTSCCIVAVTLHTALS